MFSDNNNDKALSGRLGFSPFLGLEAGLGGYVAKVDKADSKYLGMGVADFKYTLGAFEILGEGGMVFMNPLEIKVESENKDQKETIKTIKTYACACDTYSCLLKLCTNIRLILRYKSLTNTRHLKFGNA